MKSLLKMMHLIAGAATSFAARPNKRQFYREVFYDYTLRTKGKNRRRIRRPNKGKINPGHRKFIRQRIVLLKEKELLEKVGVFW
jgi:hypothetical protein